MPSKPLHLTLGSPSNNYVTMKDMLTKLKGLQAKKVILQAIRSTKPQKPGVDSRWMAGKSRESSQQGECGELEAGATGTAAKFPKLGGGHCIQKDVQPVTTDKGKHWSKGDVKVTGAGKHKNVSISIFQSNPLHINTEWFDTGDTGQPTQ